MTARPLIIILPDGHVLTRPVPADDDALYAALQDAVGGPAEQFPEAFHVLDTYSVWIHADGLDRLPVNHPSQRVIGLPVEYVPPCGPVVLLPLPDGQDNRAERAHQCRYFGVLDAVALGLVTAADAGLGELIDARAGAA